MTRQRGGAPRQQEPRRTRNGRPDVPPARVRRRTDAPAEVELTEDELRSLVDEGLDPDEVKAVTTAGRDPLDVSIFDRDTARDDLDGLLATVEEY